jgi:hypothetical protein
MTAFESFIQAKEEYRRHDGGKQPNVCLMESELFTELFTVSFNIFNAGKMPEHYPPFFELDGCLVIESNKPPPEVHCVMVIPKTRLFARWECLEMHKRMAELAGELVPLLVDADAIKDGKSVDGGDPLAIKSKAEDVAGKSAERRIGKLVREMRKLL